MSEVSLRRPRSPAWLAVLPPTLFFASASTLLASVCILYAKRIVRCRGLQAAFRASKGLCRIGMTSGWLRRLEPPGG